MGYRDKKNPWHVIFDSYKEEHPDLANDIKVIHPIFYPIVEVEFHDGRRILYEGDTHLCEEVDPNNIERSIWNLYCKADDFKNEQLNQGVQQ